MNISSAFAHKATRIGQAVLDLAYPRQCVSCGKSVDREGRYICSECFFKLPFRPEAGCSVCGVQLYAPVGENGVCSVCKKTPPAYARLSAAVQFDMLSRRLIHGLKYGRALWLVPDLADLLVDAFLRNSSDAKFDCVVPVPIHWFRRWQRGCYNQAEELAARFAREIQLPCRADVIWRTRWVQSQTHLSGNDRRKNLIGVFKATPGSLRGQRVLLIDDVATTGTTLSECAEVLRSVAEADTVECLTVARCG